MSKRVVITMPDDLYKELAIRAFTEHRSVSNAINKFVAEGLNPNAFNPIKSDTGSHSDVDGGISHIVDMLED